MCNLLCCKFVLFWPPNSTRGHTNNMLLMVSPHVKHIKATEQPKKKEIQTIRAKKQMNEKRIRSFVLLKKPIILYPFVLVPSIFAVIFFFFFHLFSWLVGFSLLLSVIALSGFACQPNASGPCMCTCQSTSQRELLNSISKIIEIFTGMQNHLSSSWLPLVHFGFCCHRHYDLSLIRFHSHQFLSSFTRFSCPLGI